MKVVQATYGVFHSFELAKELFARRYLERIYSTWPWTRLEREGVERDYVDTFAWLGLPDYLLGRTRFYPAPISAQVKRLNTIAFDHYVRARVPRCDVFIAISGAGLTTGKLVQKRGGRFVCDRGSTHQRYMDEVLRAEAIHWGLELARRRSYVTAREEACYAAADAITVPSIVAMRSFITMGVPAEKLHVIPYGVRLERFRKMADPPADSFEVLFAGQVSLRKGIPYLLQAFAQVQHPRKRLTIAGAIQPQIRPLLARLPMEGVTFLGSVPQEDLIGRMSRSHVLVLPSVEEGLAMVMAQAMACGCPVVATQATGAEEVFANGVEGFIVDDRDVESVAERMQWLADEPRLRDCLGEAALGRVRAMGGWKAYGDEWDAFLHSLCERRS